MDICFEGVGQMVATFQVSGGAAWSGMVVTLTGNGTVGQGKAGDVPCGVLLNGVRGGAAAVQIGGAVKAAYSETAPAAGWQELVCDGYGGVKAVVKSDTEAAASGLKCLVLSVDEDEETLVMKL